MRSSVRKHGALKILTVFVFVMLTCTISIAEDSNEVSPKKEVLTTLEQRMQQRIDVIFREAEITDVIRSIADMANVDIVISPKVIGKMTCTLTQVPLAEALNNILAAHGFDYVVDKNVIRVAPAAEITQVSERLVSRIYRITYASVDEVEKALNKFKSPLGTVSSNPGTSNVIVTDTESKIKAIDTFIEEIDRMTPQILVEVRVYDITSRDTLDLGIEWEAGRDTTILEPVGTNPTDGHSEPFARGLFSADTGKTDSAFSGNLRIGSFGGGLDIDVILRARQEDAHAKLLANPRILVLDNETALFHIVTEIPYAEVSYTATSVTETIKFKNVGVRLEVIPHVTRDGMLRLQVAPEFSVVVREEAFQTSNVPVVDTRKVNTITLVKDGHTVVLGGLRKKDVSKQINKIPFLGDLPLLGPLFRFKGEETVVTELLVFITPRIVEQPIIMSESEKRAYEETEFDGPKVDYTKVEQREESKEE